MTGVKSSITIDDAQVNDALTRAAEAGADTTALMGEIAGAMLFSVQRRFETESGPDGEKWSPYAPRTAKARANRKTRGNGAITPKLLRDTNRLFQSISTESSAREAAVGTNLIYAAIHQKGGSVTRYPHSRKVKFRKVGSQLRFAKKAHKRAFEKPVTYGTRTIVIPARPYLGFSAEDRATIERLALQYFNRATGVRSAGRSDQP